MGTGAHNLTKVHHAHRDMCCPYPLRVEVYTQSDMANCEDEFKDLFLNNFILAQKRIVCHHLDRLELNKNQRALLARGVSCMTDIEDEKNGVIEACVSYAGAVRVMVIDEMADVNEQVWYIYLIVVDDNLTNDLIVRWV